MVDAWPRKSIENKLKLNKHKVLIDAWGLSFLLFFKKIFVYLFLSLDFFWFFCIRCIFCIFIVRFLRHACIECLPFLVYAAFLPLLHLSKLFFMCFKSYLFLNCHFFALFFFFMPFLYFCISYISSFLTFWQGLTRRLFQHRGWVRMSLSKDNRGWARMSEAEI